MKVKIWDSQLMQYAGQEDIYNSKEEAIEYLLNYFSIDHDDQELKMVKEALEDGGEYAELFIEEVEE